MREQSDLHEAGAGHTAFSNHEPLPSQFDRGEGPHDDWSVTRRDLVKGAGAVTGAAMMEWTAFPGTAQAQQAVDAPVPITPQIS